MKLRLFRTIFFKSPDRFVLNLILVVFLSNLSVFAANDDFKNYRQCWKYETDKLTNIAPTTNSNDLILPLSDGTLLNLDVSNGTVNWKADLGGEIAAPLVSNSKVVIAASKINSEAENDKNKNVLKLRALSISTGLTIWQKDITAEQQIYLVLNGETLLYAANISEKESAITSLETLTGLPIWSKSFSAALNTKIYISGTQIYFGTSDNSVYSIRFNDGHLSKQIKVKNSAEGNLAATNGTVFFGDSKGEINALREADSRILWTLRTGGAVQDILPSKSGLLITSLDNFVYFHKYSTGKRQWRRRLASRPLSAGLLNEETVFLLANGENTALLLNLKNGKILNQISLGENNYALAAPGFVDKKFFITTLTGVLGFALDGCAKTAEEKKSAK
jgi:outer membrane protein assembly factor BamB